MIKPSRTLLFFLLLWGSGQPVYTHAAAAPIILVLGDSLSAAYGIDPDAGWVSLLARRLRAEGYPHRVVNASVSGETTSGGRRRLPELMQAHAPALVIVELGANDGLRGLPLPEINRNLVDILSTAADAGARAVVLPMQLPPNYGPEYTAGFNALFVQLEKTVPQVTLAPFFLADVALEPALMQSDGLHPTAAAQPRMLDAVWPSIETQLH
jgi:acyl-CoA thioesterase-1